MNQAYEAPAIIGRHLLTGLILSLLASVSICSAADYETIVARVAPSVVHITGYMGEQVDRPYVTASGLIVDGDGLLVSVSNLFTDPPTRRMCERFLVRFSDGREMLARAHAVDPILNLISLQVTEPGSFAPIDKAASTVRAGDGVLALAGAAAQSAPRYTIGFVRARHKTSVYGAGLGDMFIDSQIELPPDGDGGPLVNQAGMVIGINTPNVHRPDSVAFDPDEAHALPIRVVRSFSRVSKQFPTSAQSWLGFAYRPLGPDEKARTYKLLGQNAGVYIDYVWDVGPAADSDIAPGDILVNVNGKPLRHMHELDRLLFEVKAGTTAELALMRGDRGFLRTVRVEQRPPWAGYVVWRLPTTEPGEGEEPRAGVEP